MILYSDEYTRKLELEGKWIDCVRYSHEKLTADRKNVSLFLKLSVNTWYTLTLDGPVLSLKKGEYDTLTDMLCHCFKYFNSAFSANENCQWLFGYMMEVRPDLFLNSGVEYTAISNAGESIHGYNVFAYCFNNPVNLSDENGTWPSWAKKVAVAVAVVAVVAAVAAITVATAGTGTAAAVIAVGAAKGAAIGMISGAAIGAATGALRHRASKGSWRGAGKAALNGMGNGALSGAISGAIAGGISSGLCYNSGATSVGKGFDTFKQLKGEVGSPGQGNEWHHIVEQCQIIKSDFCPQIVQNTNNIVAISKTTHRAISGYYSSVQPFTNGMIVRNWLAGQSFSNQYEFGINVIKMFM